MKKHTPRGPRMFAFSLGSVYAIDGFVYGSLIAVIATIKSEMGLSDRHLGYGLWGLPVGMLVGVLASHRLTKRSALRWCIVAILLYCPLLALPGMAGGWTGLEGWQALFLALVGLGLAKGLLEGSMNVLANQFAYRMNSMPQGWLNATLTLAGAGAGFAAGSALENRVDVETYLSLVAGLCTLVAWVACGLMHGSGEGHGSESEAGGRIDKWVVGACGLSFASFVIEGIFGDWHGTYLANEVGISLSDATYAFVCFALAEATVRVVTPWLADKWGNVWVVVVGSGGVAAGTALFLTAEQLLSALAGAVLLGAGVGPIVPLAFAAAGKNRTAVVALSTTGYVGMTAGPPAIGHLADDFGGLGNALRVLAVLAGLVAILAWAVRVRPGAPEPSGCTAGRVGEL